MNKVTVKIDGMACGMCEAHISEVIRKTVPDARKVSASHKREEARFLSETEVNLDALREAVDKTGYVYVSAESTPYEKRGLFG